MSYAGRHKFRAFRKDGNHQAIKDALTNAGLEPIDTAKYGCPFDFIVPHDGRVYLIEAKDSDKPPSQRGLTDEEEKLDALLKRHKCRLYVVETPQQAVELFHPIEVQTAESWRLWK